MFVRPNRLITSLVPAPLYKEVTMVLDFCVVNLSLMFLNNHVLFELCHPLEHFPREKHTSAVASLHLVSGVEYVPPSPFTFTFTATRHCPSDPWEAFIFTHIFRYLSKGFALSCENDHLLHTSIRPGMSIESSDGDELRWQPFMDYTLRGVTPTQYHKVNPRFPKCKM